MPRYAPLPSIPLDPRNEAQLVQQASQKVYEASNQTLNDFSSGNPLAALLEGQAFAQGEFLFWANQLPQSILIEWIGPFLGAMRRLGTAATARLLVSIPASNTLTIIPEGSPFTTDSNLTGGDTVTFVSATAVEIPAGETSVFIPVFSEFVGTAYNVPANSITGASAVNVEGLVATNPQPAVGGSDVETYDQVQQRFFTLIRRKNPVSAQDWQDFFADFYGEGTLTSVQPNRPNQGTYNYLTDYKLPNGQVSFFVLGPNGTELTADQLQRGQNVVNFSVPVENQGHLYPLTLSQVQYNITLEIDANGSFGGNPKNSSLNFRDRLFNILQPGNVFPATIDPTVSDVDAAFYSTFDAATRYTDPHIESSKAYNTPPLLEPAAATYTQVYDFEPTDYLLNENDLIYTTLPNPVFYPVENSFNPYSIAKKDQTIYGNLQLKQIKVLAAGNFQQGDVLYWPPSTGGDGELHVVLESVNIPFSDPIAIAGLITANRISGPASYSPWVVGNTYQETTGTGVYAPQIIQYDYQPNEFIPDIGSSIPVSKRPGALVWVVSNNFVLQPATNDLTGAQSSFKIGTAVTPIELSAQTSYTAGQWVFTPQIGSGPDPVADPYYNYVDLTKGVVNKYAYVISNFVYDPGVLTVSAYFDSLVEQGIIKEIVAQNGDNGLPIAKYNPRFPAGLYLEYREFSGAPAQYFVACTYFTPTSTSADEMVQQGLIINLAPTPTSYSEILAALQAKTIQTPVRMFTFFKGDRTFFRQGSSVLSYTATSSVTPLFQFYIYLENGIFALTDEYNPGDYENQVYIPFFNPTYSRYAENTLLSEDGRNLYRVMRAFTPSATVTNWTNTTVVNTARYEEYQGNLLRYVSEYNCEEEILSQLGREVSAIKLGIAQITIVPKNSRRFTNSNQQLVYIWENTATATEVPQLSYFTGTTFKGLPPNYGNGTLSL